MSDSKFGNYGAANGNSKLTAEKVRLMRKLRNDGHTQYELAERFGISQPQVGKILDGQQWKDA